MLLGSFVRINRKISEQKGIAGGSQIRYSNAF